MSPYQIHSKRYAIIFYSLSILFLTACSSHESIDSSQLTGTYTLIEWRGIKPDGSVVFPYGGDASGLIQYDKDGMMSMQLQRSDRKSLGTDNYDTLDAEKVREAYKGFFSYYGTYTVDQVRNIVSHDILGCKNPDWRGRTVKRRYRLNDGMLTLESDSVIGMNHVLKWQRVTGQENLD